MNSFIAIPLFTFAGIGCLWGAREIAIRFINDLRLDGWGDVIGGVMLGLLLCWTFPIWVVVRLFEVTRISKKFNYRKAARLIGGKRIEGAA